MRIHTYVSYEPCRDAQDHHIWVSNEWNFFRLAYLVQFTHLARYQALIERKREASVFVGEDGVVFYRCHPEVGCFFSPIFTCLNAMQCLPLSVFPSLSTGVYGPLLLYLLVLLLNTGKVGNHDSDGIPSHSKFVISHIPDRSVNPSLRKCGG